MSNTISMLRRLSSHLKSEEEIDKRKRIDNLGKTVERIVNMDLSQKLQNDFAKLKVIPVNSKIKTHTIKR